MTHVHTMSPLFLPAALRKKDSYFLCRQNIPVYCSSFSRNLLKYMTYIRFQQNTLQQLISQLVLCLSVRLHIYLNNSFFHSRACLKITFRQMCVTICGKFDSNEGGIAGYVDRMRVKFLAKWGVHMTGMNFQTSSKPR